MASRECACCCLFLHRVHCEILWFGTDCFRGAACHRMVAALRCAAAKSARCRSLLVRLLHFLDCRIKWQLLSNVRCRWHFYCGGLYVLLSLPRVSRRKHFVTLFSVYLIYQKSRLESRALHIFHFFWLIGVLSSQSAISVLFRLQLRISLLVGRRLRPVSCACGRTDRFMLNALKNRFVFLQRVYR